MARIYEYECSGCESTKEVYRPIDMRNEPVQCSKCGGLMARIPFPRTLVMDKPGRATQDAYFNHGLGKVVKNDAEARQIARERGFIEVGNERVEKHITPPKRKPYLD